MENLMTLVVIVGAVGFNGSPVICARIDSAILPTLLERSLPSSLQGVTFVKDNGTGERVKKTRVQERLSGIEGNNHTGTQGASRSHSLNQDFHSNKNKPGPLMSATEDDLIPEINIKVVIENSNTGQISEVYLSGTNTHLNVHNRDSEVNLQSVTLLDKETEKYDIETRIQVKRDNLAVDKYHPGEEEERNFEMLPNEMAGKNEEKQEDEEDKKDEIPAGNRVTTRRDRDNKYVKEPQREHIDDNIIHNLTQLPDIPTIVSNLGNKLLSGSIGKLVTGLNFNSILGAGERGKQRQTVPSPDKACEKPTEQELQGGSGVLNVTNEYDIQASITVKGTENGNYKVDGKDGKIRLGNENNNPGKITTNMHEVDDTTLLNKNVRLGTLEQENKDEPKIGEGKQDDVSKDQETSQENVDEKKSEVVWPEHIVNEESENVGPEVIAKENIDEDDTVKGKKVKERILTEHFSKENENALVATTELGDTGSKTNEEETNAEEKYDPEEEENAAEISIEDGDNTASNDVDEEDSNMSDANGNTRDEETGNEGTEDIEMETDDIEPSGETVVMKSQEPNGDWTEENMTREISIENGLDTVDAINNRESEENVGREEAEDEENFVLQEEPLSNDESAGYSDWTDNIEYHLPESESNELKKTEDDKETTKTGDFMTEYTTNGLLENPKVAGTKSATQTIKNYGSEQGKIISMINGLEEGDNNTANKTPEIYDGEFKMHGAVERRPGEHFDGSGDGSEEDSLWEDETSYPEYKWWEKDFDYYEYY